MSRRIKVLIYISILLIIIFFVISALNISYSYKKTVEYIKERNLGEAKVICNQFEAYFKDRQSELQSYKIMESNFANSQNYLNTFSYDFCEFDFLSYCFEDSNNIMHNSNAAIDSKKVYSYISKFKAEYSESCIKTNNNLNISKPILLGNKLYGIIYILPVSFDHDKGYMIGVISINRICNSFIYKNSSLVNVRPFAISSDGYRIFSYDNLQIGKQYSDSNPPPTSESIRNYERMSKGEVFTSMHSSYFSYDNFNPNSKPSKKILASYPVKINGDLKYSIGIVTEVNEISFFDKRMYLQILSIFIILPALIFFIIAIIKFSNKENTLKIQAEENSKYTLELEELNKRIVEHYLMLQEANEKLQEYNKIKTDYFANISHEFRMPLTVIISSTQLMQKNSGCECYSEKTIKWIKIIKQNAQRLSRLVNNILTVIRLDAQSISLNKKNIDLVTLLKSIVEQVTPFIENKELNLNFVSKCKKAVTLIDKEKIEKVILNLLSNAIKFNKNDGSISISVFKTDQINIVIEDTGIGIPKDKLNIIFERFVQLNHLYTREYEGSGIGLSLCKDFINLHNGEILVESELGVGTKFTIKLPITNDSNIEDKKYYASESDVNIELSDII